MTDHDAERDAAHDAERRRRGRPGYHDPTAGIGGAAPAQSALSLRLALAIFGLLTCAALAGWMLLADGPVFLLVVTVVLGAVALIDLGVVARRKVRGEPG